MHVYMRVHMCMYMCFVCGGLKRKLGIVIGLFSLYFVVCCSWSSLASEVRSHVSPSWVLRSQVATAPARLLDIASVYPNAIPHVYA